MFYHFLLVCSYLLCKMNFLSAVNKSSAAAIIKFNRMAYLPIMFSVAVNLCKLSVFLLKCVSFIF